MYGACRGARNRSAAGDREQRPLEAMGTPEKAKAIGMKPRELYRTM